LIIKGFRLIINLINKPVINKALALQVYITNRLKIINFLAFCNNHEPLYFVKCPRAVTKKHNNENNLNEKKVLLKMNWGIIFL